MFFRMVYKSGQIFLSFCHNTRVWQRDRRTDRRTEFSSQYRVCITCRAVKTGQIFLPFCHNPRVWQTNGQTDRRTDRQLSHR